ncbi:MAG: hypothetical protein ACKOCH_07395, partial [Bacteroidota bacterium]
VAFFATITSAQVVDTILFENFQTDNFGDWGTVPLGDDLTWVSFDEDGLPPYDGDDNHRAWYFSQFFYNAEDTITGEVNYCAATLSYLEVLEQDRVNDLRGSNGGEKRYQKACKCYSHEKKFG